MSEKIVSLDFETRSAVDLKKSGVYKYAEDPSTDVWCLAYAFDDEPVKVWTPKDSTLPIDLIEHVHNNGKLRAWNMQFERTIWNTILVKRYKFPPLDIEQCFCTAAQAAAMALPRGLDAASFALRLEQHKIQSGKNLMMRMARPRSTNADGSHVWWDSFDKISELISYCKQDVEVERAIASHLRHLSAMERNVFLLDQTINDRGVAVNTQLVSALISVVQKTITRANIQIKRLTNGVVPTVTSVGALTLWLNSRGVDADSVSKASLSGLLASTLPDDVRAVLELRQKTGKSSTAKLVAMLNAVCADGRLRGLLLYHGASTGRWTGKLVQPQNFPRGMANLNINAAIKDVFNNDIDLIDTIHGAPLDVVSSLIRPCLVPAKGHRFIAADYAAIEARVLAWIANERALLSTFKSGGDVYKVMAAKIFNCSIDEVTKERRQLGKAAVLGCGYGMGAKKFAETCNSQGIVIGEDLAQKVVLAYRDANSNIVMFWKELEKCVVDAIAHPGIIVYTADGRLKFVVRRDFLWLVLPSGRPLAYATPSIVEEMTPWGSARQAPYFYGVSAMNGWEKQNTYGGKLAENVVQAIARDLLAEAMIALENSGYPIVLSVHDEIVAEVPDGYGSVAEFETLMCSTPSWASGCPINAEGWEGEFYRK